MRGKGRHLIEKKKPKHEENINMYVLHINKGNLDQLLHTSSLVSTEKVCKRKLFFLKRSSSSETKMF